MSLANPILTADAYKLGHSDLYPPGTRSVSFYGEARGVSSRPDVVFFGLQGFLKTVMQRAVTRTDIAEAEEIALMAGRSFPRQDFLDLVDRHGGFFPVRIEALPEGTAVRRGVPMLQVVNTDPAFFWVPGFLETALTRALWYPSTVASVALRWREALRPWFEKTADRPDESLLTAVHDFGARSVGAQEQAAIGGAAVLTAFTRTDNLAALAYLRNTYGATSAGQTYPGTDHAVMTAWGQARETEAFSHMVRTLSRVGLYSVVADSYDLSEAISSVVGQTLKAELSASDATIIIRPDSGDPVDTPVRAIAQLAYAFGTRLNARGYKLIDAPVRVLQGDGVSLGDCGKILGRLEATGFSADNLLFGAGSVLTQKVARDHYAFTVKASAVEDGEGHWHAIAKRPAGMTERGSKTGRQAVVEELGDLAGVPLEQRGHRQNHLVPVFENGTLLRAWSFEDIRARVRQARPY